MHAVHVQGMKEPVNWFPYKFSMTKINLEAGHKLKFKGLEYKANALMNVSLA